MSDLSYKHSYKKSSNKIKFIIVRHENLCYHNPARSDTGAKKETGAVRNLSGYGRRKEEI